MINKMVYIDCMNNMFKKKDYKNNEYTKNNLEISF